MQLDYHSRLCSSRIDLIRVLSKGTEKAEDEICMFADVRRLGKKDVEIAPEPLLPVVMVHVAGLTPTKPAGATSTAPVPATPV